MTPAKVNDRVLNNSCSHCWRRTNAVSYCCPLSPHVYAPHRNNGRRWWQYLFTIFYFIFSPLWHEIDTVKRVIKEYYDRITKLEDQKFDLEYLVKKKDFEVRRLFYRLTIKYRSWLFDIMIPRTSFFFRHALFVDFRFSREITYISCAYFTFSFYFFLFVSTHICCLEFFDFILFFLALHQSLRPHTRTRASVVDVFFYIYAHIIHALATPLTLIKKKKKKSHYIVLPKRSTVRIIHSKALDIEIAVV